MNRDPAFAAKFNAIFSRLAARHDAALYPFFLDGVASDPALNQEDGIHPNPRGVAVIAEKIAPYVLRLLGAPE
jgi:acyl-CoA thioesterase-1